MKRVYALLVAMLFALAAHAQPTAPDQLVRTVSERILQLIKANRDEYARDTKQLYAVVDKKVLPYFDFRVMSRAVLARTWRDASEEQRERFVKEFRDLLVRTYATALLKYTDEEIRFLPSRPADEKTTLVRTEIVRGGGGPPIQMNYSFYLSDDGWKVYDIAIEGVSLVTNYRSTYAEKVRAQGLDALIANIADANRRGVAGPAAAVQKEASPR